MSESDNGIDILGKTKQWGRMAAHFINTYTWVIFFVILALGIKHFVYIWGKKEINFNIFNRDLTTFNPRIYKVSEDEYKYNIPIRDYFVMSSYNSCVGGDAFQDWVDIEILKRLIKSAVRGFDFELYMKDGECVVAVGPDAEKGKFMLKGSYNYLDFGEVLKTLDSYGFGTVSNSSDPIFVNLRIKSTNPEIYYKISKIIQDNSIIRTKNRITDKTFTVYANLYKKYQYKNQKVKNIINEPLKIIKNKMVFICNDIAENSFWGEWNEDYTGRAKNNYKFMECINISNVIGNCLPMSNYGVVFSHNAGQLKKDLKLIHGISVPDFSVDPDKNGKWEKHAEIGVQLIYMKFYKRDGELISYIKNWDLAKKAIIRKPKHLRFFAIPIKAPRKQKKELDFGPRKCNPKNAFMQCI
jgi:hypothetical protein